MKPALINDLPRNLFDFEREFYISHALYTFVILHLFYVMRGN